MMKMKVTTKTTKKTPYALMLFVIWCCCCLSVGAQRIKEGCYDSNPSAFSCNGDNDNDNNINPSSLQGVTAEDVCNRLFLEVFPQNYEIKLDPALHAEHLNGIEANTEFCDQLQYFYSQCFFCADFDLTNQCFSQSISFTCNGDSVTPKYSAAEVLANNDDDLYANFQTQDDIDEMCQDLNGASPIPLFENLPFVNFYSTKHLCQGLAGVKHLCPGYCDGGCFETPPSCFIPYRADDDEEPLPATEVYGTCEAIAREAFFVEHRDKILLVDEHFRYLTAIPGSTEFCGQAKQAYSQCLWCEHEKENTPIGGGGPPSGNSTTGATRPPFVGGGPPSGGGGDSGATPPPWVNGGGGPPDSTGATPPPGVGGGPPDNVGGATPPPWVNTGGSGSPDNAGGATPSPWVNGGGGGSPPNNSGGATPPPWVDGGGGSSPSDGGATRPPGVGGPGGGDSDGGTGGGPTRPPWVGGGGDDDDAESYWCFDETALPLQCDALTTEVTTNLTMMEQIEETCFGYGNFRLYFNLSDSFVPRNAPFCPGLRQAYSQCLVSPCSSSGFVNPIGRDPNSNIRCSSDSSEQFPDGFASRTLIAMDIEFPQDIDPNVEDLSAIATELDLPCDKIFNHWGTNWKRSYSLLFRYDDIFLERLCPKAFNCEGLVQVSIDQDYLGASTTSQKIALVWVSRASALLSFVGASYILYSTFIRNEQGKRKTVYQQLVVGMAIFDLVTAIAWCFATAPIDKDRADYIYGAKGNEATCKTQGFFIQLGFASVFYNVSLALYYVLVVGTL
mmetsp:Transcript_18838/g.43976  ORF Transcript_18838/g.43976 Transcript_18838/m.43976 type:complete len:784 (+) Transcript_18838:158-2509(+)